MYIAINGTKLKTDADYPQSDQYKIRLEPLGHLDGQEATYFLPTTNGLPSFLALFQAYLCLFPGGG